ncbi:acyl-CoA thioesterase [Rhodoflexus caldus]|uniref:acyl-CoA thioesterase n=1 Tax=Rhodoflexus caldus TaxID=2891236 RepID=UPI002029C33D|nr:acyl-CoA thioesterase [Rhodoflexus caldus]
MNPEKLYSFKTKIDKRWSDLDEARMVNNAKVMTYFEETRIRFLNQVLAWDWEHHGLVVANANINYRVPITYKGELYGFLQCTNVGNKSLTFSSLLAQPDGEGWLTLAEATFVLVGFDFVAMTSMAIPESYKAQLQATIN